MRALVILTLILAGGLVFYFLRVPPPNVDAPQSEEPSREAAARPVESPVVASADPSPEAESHGPSKPRFPDLAAEPPTTTEPLLEELNRVTDYLLASIPDHPDSLEITARVHFWLGNSDEAVRLWDRCLQLDPRYGHAYFGKGSAAAKRGEYDAAAEFFGRSLQLTPTSTETQVALGDALINAGKMEVAIAVLNRSLGPNSQSAQREALLGQAYLHLQDYEETRSHYAAAVKLDPYLSDAHYGLAMACARLGENDESAEWMARFKELRVREREIRAGDKRDYDDLEATCWEVAKKYTDVGSVLYSRELVWQAEKLWQRAAELAPRDVNCRQALAWQYQQTNRKKEAIGMLTQLAEIEQGGIHYDLEIGRLHAELNDFESAQEAFRRVREADPRHPDGYTAAARLYADAKRDLPEALKLAREAVALKAIAPNYAVLSEACEVNGDRAGALSAIQQAMNLNPDEPRYRQRHERLKAEH